MSHQDLKPILKVDMMDLLALQRCAAREVTYEINCISNPLSGLMQSKLFFLHCLK